MPRHTCVYVDPENGSATCQASTLLPFAHILCQLAIKCDCRGHTLQPGSMPVTAGGTPEPHYSNKGIATTMEIIICKSLQFSASNVVAMSCHDDTNTALLSCLSGHSRLPKV